MEKTYIEKIKEMVNSICEENNLPQPITIPSAGKMIMDHKGVDVAIELFEGAYNECVENPNKDNPFAFAAYKATLEKTLIPNKTEK